MLYGIPARCVLQGCRLIDNMKYVTDRVVVKVLSVLVMMWSFVISDAADKIDYALVRISVANVREKPSHAAELGTQVIMGTPLKLDSNANGWWKVETPDGYQGYVIDNSLTVIGSEDLERWKKSQRIAVVSVDQTYVYDSECKSPNCRISDIVNGSVLETGEGNKSEGYRSVVLPDGRKGFVDAADVMDFLEWAARSCDRDSVIAFSRSLMGVPYLWGGTSSKSMDCSGLSKIAYLSQGVILPRNASAQAKKGKTVSSTDNLRKGDLLFFGNPATGRINHVGIYISGGRYIHSSGRVRISSLKEDDPLYEPADIITIKRLCDPDLQIMAVKNHPWYF